MSNLKGASEALSLLLQIMYHISHSVYSFALNSQHIYNVTEIVCNCKREEEKEVARESAVNRFFSSVAGVLCLALSQFPTIILSRKNKQPDKRKSRDLFEYFDKNYGNLFGPAAIQIEYVFSWKILIIITVCRNYTRNITQHLTEQTISVLSDFLSFIFSARVTF